MDRTRTVVREKPVGFGADVLQQPAVDLANEFVGGQRGIVAHDGLAGHANETLVAGRFTTAAVGISTTAGKMSRLEKSHFCQ